MPLAKLLVQLLDLHTHTHTTQRSICGNTCLTNVTHNADTNPRYCRTKCLPAPCPLLSCSPCSQCHTCKHKTVRVTTVYPGPGNMLLATYTDMLPQRRQSWHAYHFSSVPSAVWPACPTGRTPATGLCVCVCVYVCAHLWNMRSDARGSMYAALTSDAASATARLITLPVTARGF